MSTEQTGTGVEANNPEPVEAVESTLDLDRLIDETFSTPEFQSSEPHKGVDFKRVIDDLPPDARKLVHNLREDYRKKTTEISQKARELETREQVLLSQGTQEKLAALSEIPEDLDLYDPAGLQRYIEAKAAQQLQALLEPAREELRRQTRQQQVDSFKADKPDFDTLKPQMVDAIKNGRVNNVEDAYHYVKGLSAREEIKRREMELEQYKKASREAGLKVATGINTSNSKPKFANAYEAYLFEKARRAN